MNPTNKLRWIECNTSMDGPPVASTPFYHGNIPNSSGQEQKEGYSKYAEDTTYPTSTTDIS